MNPTSHANRPRAILLGFGERPDIPAEAERQRALGQIEQATTEALKDLAQESAALAVGLAGKIVDRQLDAAAHSQLIEQAVTDFSRPPSRRDGPTGS